MTDAETLAILREAEIGQRLVVSGRLAIVTRRRDVHVVVRYDDDSIEVLDPFDTDLAHARTVRRAP